MTVTQKYQSTPNIPPNTTGTVYPQTSRSLPAQRTLSNDAWRPGSSNGPMIDTRTTNITIILSVFYDYHYHHRYHYSYHNFIITILCYAPSVNTCTVGGAIHMTVYITLHYIYNNCKFLLFLEGFSTFSILTCSLCTNGEMLKLRGSFCARVSSIDDKPSGCEWVLKMTRRMLYYWHQKLQQQQKAGTLSERLFT